MGQDVISVSALQVPIYELQNDGRANLLGALLIAGQFVIPEVCLPVEMVSEAAFLPLARTHAYILKISGRQ